MSRWSAVMVLIGMLFAGVIYDRIEFAPAMPVPVEPEPAITPSLAADDTLSTVWYCPVGAGTSDSIGAHTLALTNVAADDAVAQVKLLNADGTGPSLRIDLPGRTTELVDVGALDPAPLVGAVVEIVGGKGVVGHSVDVAGALAEGPCSSTTSDSWYFADGVTTRDARNYIVLLNPFAQDVVFSVEFQTPSRTRQPDDLQAKVVQGGTVRLIDVTEFVSREPNVATVVTTIQGRLAVERLQVFDGALGPVGVALTAAVDEPQTVWRLPAGQVHAGGGQRLTLFNPNTEVAEIDLTFDLADPADVARFGLVPIEVTVSPGRLAVVDLVAEVERLGLDLPAEFGVTVTSTNGVGVVVERWQITPPIDTSLIGAGGVNASVGRFGGFAVTLPGFQDGIDVESPENAIEDPTLAPDEPEAASLQASPVLGVGVSHGSSVLSTDWVVPWSTLGEPGDSFVVVTSPEGGLVSVQAVLAGELLPPTRGQVEPGGRIQVPIEVPIAGSPLVVTSETPIAVEVQTVTAEGRLDVIAAVPILDTQS